MNAITQVAVDIIEQLKLEGCSNEQIGRFTGRSQATVAAVLDGRHSSQSVVPPTTRNARRHESRRAVAAIVGERTSSDMRRGVRFLPTPQQIEDSCRAIRETWSEAEFFSRRDTSPAAVRPPMAPSLSLADGE
jgi:hypothetical protein